MTSIIRINLCTLMIVLRSILLLFLRLREVVMSSICGGNGGCLLDVGGVLIMACWWR